MDQFGRKFGKPVISALSRAELDGHVLAFGVAQFAQPLLEGFNKVCARSQRVRPENPYATWFR
jgi:hypothetical protein